MPTSGEVRASPNRPPYPADEVFHEDPERIPKQAHLLLASSHSGEYLVGPHSARNARDATVANEDDVPAAEATLGSCDRDDRAAAAANVFRSPPGKERCVIGQSDSN